MDWTVLSCMNGSRADGIGSGMIGHRDLLLQGLNMICLTAYGLVHVK